ncbi:MAG: cold shock domain-containing protein, partial [Candidatus Levybacteria bacterium]|nr:cold shock domain-containing protein [Candidatus Levybacteria bacterium]
MPEQGIVKWFDARPGKRFGFISLGQSQPELFFHFNDGRSIEAGDTMPQFSGHQVHREPLVGDAVVFERSTGSQGKPKACPWGYQSQWHIAQVTIWNRPVYRLMEFVSTPSNLGHPRKLWQGSNLSEFAQRIPYGSDLLRPIKTHDLKVDFWWEVLEPGGDWQRCQDP